MRSGTLAFCEIFSHRIQNALGVQSAAGVSQPRWLGWNASVGKARWELAENTSTAVAPGQWAASLSSFGHYIDTPEWCIGACSLYCMTSEELFFFWTGAALQVLYIFYSHLTHEWHLYCHTNQCPHVALTYTVSSFYQESGLKFSHYKFLELAFLLAFHITLNQPFSTRVPRHHGVP